MTVIKNLKTLLSNWFNLKTDAESNYHTLFSENLTYNKGVLKTTDVTSQTINVTVSGNASSQGYATMMINCTITPAVNGQTVTFKGGHVDKTVTTTSNGVVNSGYVQVDDDTSVFIDVEGILVGNTYYSGGSKTYTFNRN